jgi:transcriptional regulator with XRE-family HTH domain
MSEGSPYRDLVARNIAAERERRSLSQADLATQMSGLGFRWVRQTVTEAERPGGRRITVEELVGLTVALGVPIDVLLLPPPGSPPVAALPGGRLIVFRTGGQPPFDLDALRETGDVEFVEHPGVREHGVQEASPPQTWRVNMSKRTAVRVEPAEER